MKTIQLVLCFVHILALHLFIHLEVFAQDPQFSNYEATFLYLNPAFAGISGDDWRINANWRKQWPQIGSSTTGFFAGEYARGDFGFGVLGLKDKTGTAPLHTTQTSLSFSHTICFTGNLQFVHGYQFNYYHKKLGEDYIFVDDFVNNTSLYAALPITNNYINLSLGYLLIYRNVWMGVSLNNILKNPPLNTNDLGLVNTGNNSKGKYYGKLSIHGGFSNIRFPGSYLRLSGTANFRQLGRANQFELGLAPAYKVSDNLIVGVGAGYRGLFPTREDLRREDGFVFNLGIRIPEGFSQTDLLRSSWMLVLSHDVTTSGLEPTGGSYELTLVLQWSHLHTQSNQKRNQRCKKFIPSIICPVFLQNDTQQETKRKTKAPQKKKPKRR